MSDIVLNRDQGIPSTMRTRYTDMGDGTHALNTAVGQVGSVTLPAGAPITGQAVIAVTGTAVRLSATSVPLPGGGVLLWADSGNSAAMTAGGAGVTNAVDGTGNGVVIPAGEQRVVFAADLRDVYVNGTATDHLSYSAV